MKMYLLILMLCVTGCAIHYQNTKAISGKGKDIRTPYGTINGAKTAYVSSLDLWIPCKFNVLK